MKAWKICRKVLAVGVVSTAVLFFIYLYNLDMKLVAQVYKLLGKHYENMDRERRV